MIYLLIVSLLWAFSFGLIKDQLTGLDPVFVAFARMGIALLIFMPFFRWEKFKAQWPLLLVGAVQFGLMYIFYIYSYQWLKAFQVALFTIFTPLYVTLLEDLLRKKFHALHLGVALLSILGTGIILWTEIDSRQIVMGFLFVQASNLCFALGQILYRKIRLNSKSINEEAQIFAALYLGAVLVTGLAAVLSVSWSAIFLTKTQIWTLIYLGILASGFGFFLWNYGALKVNAGTLAVFNNLKIPLAIGVSLLIFGEKTNIVRLLAGGTLVGLALWINEKFSYKLKS
ncbi:EamA family transporter [Caldithrix abyssi]